MRPPEASSPGSIAAVTATFYLGWRQSWIIISIVLVVLVLPAVHWLLKVDRTPMSAQAPGEFANAEPGQRQWTVAEMVRDRMFYLLLPGVIAPAFAITGVFFHQAHLATVKGWSLAWIAANYPVYAVFTVGAAMGAGWAVDRWSAKRLLIYYQPTLVAGLVILAWWDTTLAVPVFMAAAGITAGAGNTIVSALWAEIYGVRHLGAIRSLLFAGAVAATALAPGLMGWGIDEGIGIESQFIAIAAYILVGIGLFFVARRQLKD
ncbi:MAG: MFS transporter [Hyphomicrobiales bacterium]